LLSGLPVVALAHFWSVFNSTRLVTTGNTPQEIKTFGIGRRSRHGAIRLVYVWHIHRAALLHARKALRFCRVLSQRYLRSSLPWR
jgi:hypothetical protein